MSYRDLNSFLKSQYGTKVYKIALSTPFSCPNRDGTVGVGGCLFCSASGSGNFASDPALPIEEQIRWGKERVRKKAGENPRFIAYFQSFSSTWGSIDIQRKLFSAAIEDPEVVILSVATRPDCLSEEVLSLLGELNQKKPVWVELGLQTANEKTARYIRRGYENSVFTKAVERLRRIGLSVIVHLILGLPEESHEDEIASLRFTVSHDVQGIKFHLLHVLRGTDLAKTDYRALEMEEYVFRVTDLIRYVPESIIIHRLTGDGDKKELIAPLWSGDKKRVLNAISKRIRESGLRQGEALKEFSKN
ncbi:MAG: TIGR01212 family radical SAM protein [Clostridia bacterium]|nr:TIGR01212 family radical SAM protein [Clostridia bacterium]